MNNKVSNPFLKQLISEIANNANKGRLDLSWEIIEEAKKKKKLRKEAEADTDVTDTSVDSLLGGSNETPKNTAQAAAGAGAPPAAKTPPAAATPPAAGAAEKKEPDTKEKTDAGSESNTDGEGDTEEADQAKDDATKAKAELEKAKAEKEQAEKEIKDHSYVKLSSTGGTEFLLGKVLDHAFKTNTIDALASEMVNALRIETPEDMNNFSSDMATHMVLPGMPDLIASMKTLATKEPETPEESKSTDEPKA